ncbi:MAG: phage tail sheath family protein, partial [Caulobacter sp.]|nr:phage tail sheath family protein [Caulobacter sp.]
FLYLEASIDRGTQWAVFEPNGERLWANVRTTVSDFLYNEWVNGALLGTTPKEAFFVQCDRSTMTQNDLDNGRLICLIGVAAIKPAEFVIFRIGQKTADARG